MKRQQCLTLAQVVGRAGQGPKTSDWIFEPFMQIMSTDAAAPRLMFTLSLTNGSCSLFCKSDIQKLRSQIYRMIHLYSISSNWKVLLIVTAWLTKVGIEQAESAANSCSTYSQLWSEWNVKWMFFDKAMEACDASSRWEFVYLCLYLYSSICICISILVFVFVLVSVHLYGCDVILTKQCKRVWADGRRQACLVSHLPHSNCHSDFHKFCVTTWIFRCSLSNAMSMSKSRKEEVPKVMSLIKVRFFGKVESRGRSFQSDKNQNTGCRLTKHHHHCRGKLSHCKKVSFVEDSHDFQGIIRNSC